MSAPGTTRTRHPAHWRWHVNATARLISTTRIAPGSRCSACRTRPTCSASVFCDAAAQHRDHPGYFEGFPNNGALDVNAYLFQPLTPGLGDSTQPIVLPVINRDWVFQPDSIGGTLKFNTNLLDIVREVGTQTRRLSLGGEWDKTFYDGIGGEYKFQASVRGDAYSVNNLSNPRTPICRALFFAKRPAGGRARALRFPRRARFPAGRPDLGLSARPSRRRFHLLVQPTVATFAGPNRQPHI
jgi:hypothetical protein